MQPALRPLVTVGIAAVGASMVIANPVASPADVEVRAAAVRLAAQPVTYEQVFSTAIENLQAIVETIDGSPAPILSNIYRNQTESAQAIDSAVGVAVDEIVESLLIDTPRLIQTAIDQVQSGQILDAVNTLLIAVGTPLLPLGDVIAPVLDAVKKPAGNLVAALDTVNEYNLKFLAVGLGGPLIAGAGAAGVAIQGVLEEVGGGTPRSILQSTLDAPATVLDGVLNGGQNMAQVGSWWEATGYGPNLGSFLDIPIIAIYNGIYAGGLLNPHTTGGAAIVADGTIPALLNFRDGVATAIAPPARILPAGEGDSADDELVAFSSSEDDSSRSPAPAEPQSDGLVEPTADHESEAAIDVVAEGHDRADATADRLKAAADRARDRAEAGLTKARNRLASSLSYLREHVGEITASLPAVAASSTSRSAEAEEAGEGSSLPSVAASTPAPPKTETQRLTAEGTQSRS